MVLRLVDSLLQLANSRFEAGALHDARRILANVISQPNIRRRQLVKGLVMCAAVEWSLGNSKTSEQHARLAVKLAPYSASAHLALAIALLARRRVSLGKSHLTLAALYRKKTSRLQLVVKAWCAMLEGDAKKASQLYRQCTQASTSRRLTKSILAMIAPCQEMPANASEPFIVSIDQRGQVQIRRTMEDDRAIVLSSTRMNRNAIRIPRAKRFFDQAEQASSSPAVFRLADYDLDQPIPSNRVFRRSAQN